MDGLILMKLDSGVGLGQVDTCIVLDGVEHSSGGRWSHDFFSIFARRGGSDISIISYSSSRCADTVDG